MKNFLKYPLHFFGAIFSKEESLHESKEKWNRFGKENPRYFVFTKLGESIDEKTFRHEGERDYRALVAEDLFLQEKLKNKNRVLEIGCGAGRITEFFSKNFTEVWGIDISASMIEEASRRLSGLSNVQLVTNDGVSIPAPAEYFDFVFSYIVFQHMPNIDVVRRNMEEIARVLKPGGIAKIQLRGTPISRSSEFYGPSFDKTSAMKLFKDLPVQVIKSEGEGQKYYWFWLEKK